MPIDPDAYMSGAIPTLSRGGAWLPGEPPDKPGGSLATTPSPKQSNAPSGIASGMGMDMFSGFWKSPMYAAGPGSGQEYRDKFRNSRTVPPNPLGVMGGGMYPSTITMSQGWAAQPGQPPTPSRFGERPPIHTRHSLPAPAPSTIASESRYTVASPNKHVSSVPNPARVRTGSEVWAGGSWENGAGAPLPMPREPDYDAKSRRPGQYDMGPQPRRGKAETLPAPPTPLELGTFKQPRWETYDARAHDKRSSRRSSMDHQPLSRPKPSRRHTYEPSVLHSEQEELESSSPPSQRDLAFDHDSRSPTTKVTPPSTRPTLTHDRSRSLTKIQLSHLRGMDDPNVGNSPYRPLRNSDDSSSGTSPYVKLSPRRKTRHSLQSTAPTHGSTRYMPSVSNSYAPPPPRQRNFSAPQSHSSRVPSSLSTASAQEAPHRPPALDISSLSSALPTPTTPTPRHGEFLVTAVPRRAPPSLQVPLNMGSRSSEEDLYDPYMMHPAAATPPRADIDNVAVTMHIANAGQSSLPSGAVGTTAAGDAVLSGTYKPLGFAEPTRKLEWNRDGPAMRTHGVAWKRHSEGLVLPHGPAGPRWTQARPPRSSVVTGGEWGQSGGNH